jgi:hypothetical protein
MNGQAMAGLISALLGNKLIQDLIGEMIDQLRDDQITRVELGKARKCRKCGSSALRFDDETGTIEHWHRDNCN